MSNALRWLVALTVAAGASGACSSDLAEPSRVEVEVEVEVEGPAAREPHPLAGTYALTMVLESYRSSGTCPPLQTCAPSAPAVGTVAAGSVVIQDSVIVRRGRTYLPFLTVQVEATVCNDTPTCYPFKETYAAPSEQMINLLRTNPEMNLPPIFYPQVDSTGVFEASIGAIASSVRLIAGEVRGDTISGTLHWYRSPKQVYYGTFKMVKRREAP